MTSRSRTAIYRGHTMQAMQAGQRGKEDAKLALAGGGQRPPVPPAPVAEPFAERPIPVLAELEMARGVFLRICALQQDLAGHLGRVERVLAGGLLENMRARAKRP